MPSVESVPVSIPDMDTLTDAKEAMVTELLHDVLKHYGETYPNLFLRCGSDENRRILAYKFLKARAWKPADAMEMITSTIQFREEHKTDSASLFPCVFSVRGFDEEDLCRTLQEPYTEKQEQIELCHIAMAPYYSVGYHYWDKGGHPVIYDFSGRCKVKELLKAVATVTPIGKHVKDTILDYHLYMNLVQECLLRYSDIKSVEKGNRRILGVTVVLDAEGLHLGMINLDIIDIVRAIFQMDQKYFPEVLHRLFVINSPPLVTYAFGLIKGSLDKNTQEKVIFCDKSNSADILKKIIEEDKIPKFLGGTCECPGGCVPGIDMACRDIAEASMHTPLTENISISAGKRHVVEFFLHPEEQIKWEFMCTKSHKGHAVEILFNAFFTKQEGPLSACENCSTGTAPKSRRSSKDSQVAFDAFPTMKIKSGKMDADNDKFVATSPGVLRLEWDNHASWIHGKHLQLRIIRAGTNMCEHTCVDS